MTKLFGCLCTIAVVLMVSMSGLGVAATPATTLTYFLHYEPTSTDCVGDVFLDNEDYPDPGHRCAVLEQQLEPTSWVPESFAPVTLDTSRQGSARLAVTGAAFETAALKIRLYGVRNDGQKILIGRAASAEFSSGSPEPTIPQPGVPEFEPQTHLVNLFFSIRPIAKNVVFATVSFDTDLTGFAPGAYIELDKPASSFTIPTIDQTTTGCPTPCPIPQPTPPS